MAGKRSSRGKHRRVTPTFHISRDRQRDIAAMVLLALCLFTVYAAVIPAGEFGSAWGQLVGGAFGWGWPVVVAATAALAISWLRQRIDEDFTFSPTGAAGAIILLIAFLGALHLFASAGGDPQAVPVGPVGGGQVGYIIASILAHYFGALGAFGLLLTIAAVGGYLAAGVTLAEVIDVGREIADSLRSSIQQLLHPHAHEPIIRATPTGPPRPSLPPAPPAQVTPQPPVTESGSPVHEPPALPAEEPAAPRSSPAPVAPQPSIFTQPSQPVIGLPPLAKHDWSLPPLDLLETTGEAQISREEIERRYKIIEKTLATFGIDVQVKEVNQGPTVTQFGIKPAEGVTVNRILARTNDLALALAASPIRIEAPMPGRSLIGIEVPNTTVSTVVLRSVIESTAFQKLRAKSKLAIALGYNVSNEPVAADLAKMPHLLIAGATGSGKSVCINAIIACLLFHNTPDDLRFIMVDPKMVELVAFNGIPHLISPVVTDVDKVVNVLKWAIREMERRYKLFSASGARNIDAYNKQAAGKKDKEGKEREHLPYIIIVIDELADIMMAAPDEVERSLCRLAQMSRATGIHLIIATQRPSVDVVTGLIKANFPARISFAVTSQVDSRVVLDTPGAEKLLGRGDMLYMASDSSNLVRLQGVFVSDKELEALVSFWRAATPAPTPDGDVVRGESEGIPWIEQDVASEEDPLLKEAKHIVAQAGHASVSLLQRKLRIGYARAARLIDIMEAQGFISGPVDGGRVREVFLTDKEKPQSPSA